MKKYLLIVGAFVVTAAFFISSFYKVGERVEEVSLNDGQGSVGRRYEHPKFTFEYPETVRVSYDQSTNWIYLYPNTDPQDSPTPDMTIVISKKNGINEIPDDDGCPRKLFADDEYTYTISTWECYDVDYFDMVVNSFLLKAEIPKS